jgi:enoyl-CoA hydratase
LEILLTGRTVPASEAQAIGLIDRLAPAGQAERIAIELASELAHASAPAVAAIKRCVDIASSQELERGIEFEAAEENALFNYGEAREGIAAFVERRSPRFGPSVRSLRPDGDG